MPRRSHTLGLACAGACAAEGHVASGERRRLSNATPAVPPECLQAGESDKRLEGKLAAEAAAFAALDPEAAATQMPKMQVGCWRGVGGVWASCGWGPAGGSG